MIKFLILFALCSIIHILAIRFHRRKLRHYTKVMLLPFLAAVYLAGAKTISLFPVLALFFGWLGDISLIKSGKKIYFFLGMASFLLGHIFYSISYISVLELFNFPVLVISAAAAALLGILLFRLIHPNGEFFIPFIAYMVFIEIMSLLALQIFVTGQFPAGLLILAGSLCFVCSDALLGYYKFRTMSRYGSIFIMVLYIIGQSGIILGLCYL